VIVEASVRDAPVLALVGGLAGDDAGSVAIRTAVADYSRRSRRPVRLLAVPLANPDGATVRFPPTGVAYREQGESHALWRWLGTQAPDLVVVASKQDGGLVDALGAQPVADMGRIPARNWPGTDGLLSWLERQLWSSSSRPPRSEARLELRRRLARTPRELAAQLAQHYGRDFEQPWYIAAVALVARLRLGHVQDVQRLAEPWVDGTKDSLARPNALVMAGHIVFTGLARTTGDPRYTALVRKVADLGFDASGQMLEAMPYHDRYSDSVFMGTTILAQAGALTGERRYFAMAERHLRYMQALVLRPDGLYRHRSDADVAWGRGNGFAALGLALTLSEMPRDAPGRAHVRQSYRNLMAALLPWQNRDGLWRNVVDHPGAFAEYSGTAMIGFALQRGLDRGWIRGRAYQRAVEQAWQAVNARTSSTGSLVDVCESTANLTTLQQYLDRAAILGNDPRGGAMALLFATELMQQ
ncbi:MAG: glycoside hydrolase family 88 protein, partial [Pseudomonadota bacterium]|nr:glycoside hydrolase family 88 protein [Pseudomonadota bacterium]